MRLRVTKPAAAAVRRGSPWVYRDAIDEARGLESGAAVELVDPSGAFLAHGYADTDSPIAVRVVSREPGEPFGPRLVASRMAEAVARRDALFDEADTNAVRLCNGEGDDMPGIVLDRYGGVAVARLDTQAVARAFEEAVPAIAEALHERGIESIAMHAGRSEPARASKLTSLAGPEPPSRVVVVERGMRMEVDLAHGQKTGAFLDQRENRARVRQLATKGARALNLFSYAGGFSIAAALGGAAHVTSVDLAAAAHASASRSFRENGLDPSAHAFVSADAFAFLERADKDGLRFDLVVSDPPSFAPNERAKPRALAAYAKLHAACARVLAKGGRFCASSCSTHVGVEAFLATLVDTPLRVLEVHGQPADHPTLPAWPEGRYLKFVVLA